MDDEVDYDEMVGHFDFEEKGDGHIGVTLKNPISSLKAVKLRKEVDDILDKRYPKDRRRTDNEADAFRHALWSYKMAKEMGAETAKEMGDAHERHGYNNNSKGQRLMDLHNNKVGREQVLNPYAKNYKDEKVVESALRDGYLKTRPYNVKGELPLYMQRRGGITATGKTYGKR